MIEQYGKYCSLTKWAHQRSAHIVKYYPTIIYILSIALSPADLAKFGKFILSFDDLQKSPQQSHGSHANMTLYLSIKFIYLLVSFFGLNNMANGSQKFVQRWAAII